MRFNVIICLVYPFQAYLRHYKFNQRVLTSICPKLRWLRGQIRRTHIIIVRHCVGRISPSRSSIQLSAATKRSIKPRRKKIHLKITTSLKIKIPTCAAAESSDPSREEVRVFRCSRFLNSRRCLRPIRPTGDNWQWNYQFAHYPPPPLIVHRTLLAVGRWAYHLLQKVETRVTWPLT